MPTFGDRFQAVLHKRGLTQAAAAKALDTTQSGISYYCNLERPPRRGTLLNIADRLDVSVAELTGQTDVAEPKKRLLAKTPVDLEFPPDLSVCSALSNLKARWKKKPHERETMKHLIAALFPEDTRRILAWLEQK